MNSVPILVIAFNRTSTLLILLERLKSIGADNIYFAVDGPRKDKADDASKVEEVKRVIDETFQPPEHHCHFQSSNMGVRYGPPAAISWFFSLVEEGIILEDDCIPGDDFIFFASWALARYRDVDSVKMIAGFNRFGRSDWKESYHFVKTAMIWGWASWQRAWKDFDPNFDRWGTPLEAQRLRAWLRAFPVQDFWKTAIKAVSDGRLVTWDVAWCWTVFNLQGLVIYPKVSLIQNIGFGNEATNTSSEPDSDERSKVRSQRLIFPYIEPRSQVPDRSLQQRINRKEFWRTNDTLYGRVESWLRALKHRFL